MNFLSRAIAAELLRSSPSPRKCLLLLHHVPALQHYSYSRTTNYRTGTSRLKTHQEQRYTAKNSEAELQKSSLLSRSEMVQKKALVSQREKEEEQEAKASMDWPRPSEIPWQAKVANSVNLIGRVHIPVQFQASPDGKYWAGTIITQQEDDNGDSASDSSPFWIPIIFEGDLAHIAACHLKEKDCIYITGQLSAADPPPVTFSQSQAYAQVMVRSINFVQCSSHLKKTFAPCQKKERGINSASMSEDGNPALSSWRDLLKNPERWWDHRENKLNGLVKPKHPDFKHKDSGLSLWIGSAPKWLLTELEGLEFDVQPHRMKQVKEGRDGDSWKNLVGNPDKWWDNRSNKVNEKSPDFKHKNTGEGLWLSDSPAWVLSRLPPVKAKENVSFGKRNTLLSQTIREGKLFMKKKIIW